MTGFNIPICISIEMPPLVSTQIINCRCRTTRAITRYHLTPPSPFSLRYTHTYTRLNYGIICVKARDANKMYACTMYERTYVCMHARCIMRQRAKRKFCRADQLPRVFAESPFPLDPAIHMQRSRVRPVKAAHLARNILMGRSTGCLFVKRHLTELLFRLKISDSYSIKRLFLTFPQFVLSNFAGKAK